MVNILRKDRWIGLLLGISVILCGCGQSVSDQEREGLQHEEWEQQLQETDHVLYEVNCGAGDMAGGAGLYQSVVDQEYGLDEQTGKSWGYQPQEYMTAVKDESGEDLTAYRWEVKEGTEYDNESTGFYYLFEVPQGEYEITAGFYNPFSARTVSVEAEDETLIEDLKILKYQKTEEVCYQEVTDGCLNIKVYNPKRNKDAMKNPILSYLIVRAVPGDSREMLVQYMELLEPVNQQEKNYKQESFLRYLEQYNKAEELLVKEEQKNTAYREAYRNLRQAYESLEEIMRYQTFNNERSWTDDEGNVIQAHGGQVQRLTYTDKETNKKVTKWWWVGEDKTQGAHGGICAYSSDDLYNWHNEGIVMRNVSGREQLDEVDYYKKLYGDCTEQEKDHIYECLSAQTAIIERPKLIYNEKTDTYVMWFHADGPTKDSQSSYAAASAGVAVSKTPYGPFRFIERYRLDTCPEDQEDMYPQSKGMARDMNLFTDDDGTAYIIYSSEENLTLYISKLNDSYTYLATDPEDAVYGVDYIRLFPGAQREAPALFKREGVYYLMTSGCTGWTPNQARYYRADSVLGEWENCGDPCIEDTKQTTFDSQSTCIFAADDNTWIYMGDRWYSDDLANSGYIWLPVDFNEEGSMNIAYQKEWSLQK